MAPPAGLTAEEGQAQARRHCQHGQPHARKAQADELPAGAAEVQVQAAVDARSTQHRWRADELPCSARPPRWPAEQSSRWGTGICDAAAQRQAQTTQDTQSSPSLSRLVKLPVKVKVKAHLRPALSMSPAATTVPSTLVAPTAALASAPDWMPAFSKTAGGGGERAAGGPGLLAHAVRRKRASP